MLELHYPRHNFAWVDPRITEGDLATCNHSDKSKLLKWVQEYRPFIVPRARPDLSDGYIDLGLATPPSDGKRRIYLRVSEACVIKHTGPPKLADLLPTAPTKWLPVLQDLVLGAEYLGVDIRVYGSFAWEFMTKVPYVVTSSDVDLVWQPNCGEQVIQTIELIEKIEKKTTCILDGEVLFDGGIAVAWRELCLEQSHVLVKSQNGPQLREICSLDYAS